MPELPDAMRTVGRAPDQVFRPDELLYRRVPLDTWEEWDDPIEIDAVELPDMSVVRSKYGHPEWVRFEGDEYKYDEWGVIGFFVEDIPPGFRHLGIYQYTFGPVHEPLRKNYPHSVVRAYEDDRHVEMAATLDHEVNMRWRELLARKLKKIIAPKEVVDIHQEAPQAA